jgi:hypothetical protein
VIEPDTTYAVTEPGCRCAGVYAPGGNVTSAVVTALPGTSGSGSQDSSRTCVAGLDERAASVADWDSV